MNISDIKLIIWDLDETLWEGVLSDGTVSVNPEYIELIRNTTDAGVINSICSKNDHADVEKFMTGLGVWDLFVFTSINWSPKGERVRQIISEMNLRDVNVLFIDDNHLNLEEVKAACPGIMAEFPEVIPSLAEHFRNAEKKDLRHARLDQYKVLEKKKEFRASTGSNEEFLYNCNVKVDICHDCAENTDRILDLVQRSNQLNFTKVRSTKEELEALFADKDAECGYAYVKDRFGEYGITGFYAIRKGVLEHFVFSCRTLGMGVEQYVYNVLGRPELTVVGDVSSSLEGPAPAWINRKDAETGTSEKADLSNTKTVIKGPCDMELIFSFVKESKNIIKEFVYVNRRGISIEGGNHTTHIVQSLALSDAEKERLAKQLPFGDRNMYNTAVFGDDIGAVYLSLFTDPNLGLYREKSSGIVVAFGEWTNDLTDESLWDSFIAHELFDANCSFTKESLQYIKDNFEFLGRISPEETVRNLDIIRSKMAPDAKLLLNLGSEIQYTGDTPPAYEGRHLYHKELNDLVKKWASGKENVHLVELTKYISSPEDYTNNINHFAKSVYFSLAKDILAVLSNDELKIRRRKKPRYIKKFANIMVKIKRKLGIK